MHIDTRVRSSVRLVHRVVAESTSLGLAVVGASGGRAETSASTNSCGASADTGGGASGLGVRSEATSSSSSGSSSGSGSSKTTALARLAKTTRLLIAGAGRAGAGATAVLVAKTMAALACSSGASGANSSTTKDALSGTAHSMTLPARVKTGSLSGLTKASSLSAVSKILSVVVTAAVQVHALVGIELLPLQLLPVRLGATLKLGQLLSCLLSKSASFSGELVQSLGREDGSSMVHGGSMVSLMNRNSGVDDMRLNGLLLDDRLNMFVNMVMDTLASYNRSSGGRVGGAVSLAGVSELGSLSVESGTGLLLVSMVESLVLDGNEVVVVLLRKSLLVSDGLNSCVVVLLVNLLIESSSHVLMSVRADMLLGDMRPDILIDSGLVLSIVGEEARDGLLCLFHFDFV